jgi:threonine dehydrogenase-like Zn-dependent dehydrogenase
MQDIAARFLTPGGAIHSYAIYAEMSQPDFADLLPSGHPHDRIDPDQLSAHEEVCGMLLDGSLTATGWITARYPLDGFAEAWAAVQNKKGLKTLIEMP